MKMCVGRPALQKFYDDLLAEALSVAVSGEAAQSVLSD